MVHDGFAMASRIRTSCSTPKGSSPKFRLQRGPGVGGAMRSRSREKFASSRSSSLPWRWAIWVGGIAPCFPSIQPIMWPTSLCPPSSVITKTERESICLLSFLLCSKNFLADSPEVVLRGALRSFFVGERCSVSFWGSIVGSGFFGFCFSRPPALCVPVCVASEGVAASNEVVSWGRGAVPRESWPLCVARGLLGESCSPRSRGWRAWLRPPTVSAQRRFSGLGGLTPAPELSWVVINS